LVKAVDSETNSISPGYTMNREQVDIDMKVYQLKTKIHRGLQRHHIEPIYRSVLLKCHIALSLKNLNLIDSNFVMIFHHSFD